MIASVNRGEAVAVSASGEPPALLTTTSRRPSVAAMSATIAPTCSGSRTSAATNRPAIAALSAGGRRVRTRRRRAGIEEALRDRPPDALRPAGDEHDPPGEVERSFQRFLTIAYGS